MTNMNFQSNDIFGIRRSTILIISVALAIGSFSAWKAFGGGSATTARISVSGPALAAGVDNSPSVVAGLQTEPHSSTVRSPAAHTTASLGTAILTKANTVAADRPTKPHPAVKTDLIPIEQIQVGDRVLAESPTGEEDTAFGSEIIPSDWRKLTLRAPKRDGTVAEVVLLRPLTWLNEQHGEVGGTVFISVPECGIDGNANVLAIVSCPEIHSGAGRVVTGTFLHQARSTITLTIAGQSEPIECTGNHPFWSEDRQAFVRADSLQPHETLRTATGLTTVESWTPDLNPTPVYNIEVHGAHVYHVGTSGVVVHNPGGLPILSDCPDFLPDSIRDLAGKGPVVLIGRGMERVQNAADVLRQAGIDVKVFDPPKGFANLADGMESNRSWLKYWVKDKGATVIDIGMGSIETASDFYNMEQNSIYKYWQGINVIRWALGGGL